MASEKTSKQGCAAAIAITRASCKPCVKNMHCSTLSGKALCQILGEYCSTSAGGKFIGT